MYNLTNEDVLGMDYKDFKCEDFFEEIGVGSTRVVYGIDKDRVAKVSNNMAGSSEQNRNEKYVWENATVEQKEYLAPIIDGNDNVVIMSRCEKLDNTDEIPTNEVVQGLVDDFNLGDGDIFKDRNSWGKLKGNIVLVDYGLTNDTHRNHYEMDDTSKDDN